MWDSIFLWVIHHYIEIFGALSGILYIFFSIRKSLLLWPIGIVTSAAYIIVFFNSTLYADMLLQVYYLLISFYGWYYWIKSKGNNQQPGNQIHIVAINFIEWIWTISATVLLTVLLYFPLHKYTNASNPFWDGFVSAGSIIATWMLARKILEQWIFWIVVDGVSIGLFVYKKLYPTAILFIIYTILAVFGYLKWKKDLKSQVN